MIQVCTQFRIDEFICAICIPGAFCYMTASEIGLCKMIRLRCISNQKEIIIGPAGLVIPGRIYSIPDTVLHLNQIPHMGSTGICHSGHKHTWYSICVAQQLKASGISCTDRLHRSITIRVTKCTVSRLIFTACRIRFCIGCTVTDIIMNLFYGLISECTSRELLIDRFRCFRHDRIHLRLCSINRRFFDIGRNTWNCYILYHTVILIQLRRII